MLKFFSQTQLKSGRSYPTLHRELWTHRRMCNSLSFIYQTVRSNICTLLHYLFSNFEVLFITVNDRYASLLILPLLCMISCLILTSTMCIFLSLLFNDHYVYREIEIIERIFRETDSWFLHRNLSTCIFQR